ncbi:hypothetical protein PUN28_010921 [Cardiocondyla obscurior]|uniref:Uncharacterized protein n=1 Tax=Cardiocondyla obscurior TaxID=286306 RepID=A0AAW2FLR3_9HYME
MGPMMKLNGGGTAGLKPDPRSRGCPIHGPSNYIEINIVLFFFLSTRALRVYHFRKFAASGNNYSILKSVYENRNSARVTNYFILAFLLSIILIDLEVTHDFSPDMLGTPGDNVSITYFTSSCNLSTIIRSLF